MPNSEQNSSSADQKQKVWNLIRGAHSALLVTIAQDGTIDSRPMGCLQSDFDDTLWFLTFRHSLKIDEVRTDNRVLVSYAKPSEYEYVSLSGRATVLEDNEKLKELWFEGLRVWFPNGPDDPEIALLAVHVEQAKYWTNAASVATYAWAYIKARLSGDRPSPDEIVDTKSVHF
jgi:general stress protein 26